MRIPGNTLRSLTRGVTLATAVALLAPGCAADRDPQELFGPSQAGQLVVQAQLLVDAPVPEVRVSRTTAPDVLPAASNGETGATVRVRTGGTVIEYADAGQGRYAPVAPPLVLPGTEYRLEVTTGRGERASAVTTTPARFAVTDWALLDGTTQERKGSLATFAELGELAYDAPQNRLAFAGDLLEARFTPPGTPAIQVGLLSLDPDSDFTIDPDFFSQEDFDSLERRTSSPPLVADLGYVRMPWFAVFFQGRYQVKIFAIDRNWYDFIRTDPRLAQGGPGFGGTAGDSFERPVFHVDGAIGLFGSASVDSVGFRVFVPQRSRHGSGARDILPPSAAAPPPARPETRRNG